jgi:6-phosphofructokinase 1
MCPNKKIEKIAILTSGGDAPGMNACIRAVVRTALTHNTKVVGVEGGFEGLIHGNFLPLGLRDVGGIMQRGGTILQTARCKEFHEPRGQREAIRQMNNNGIDGLVIVGGDGSLTGAKMLADQGVCVVGVPASIDNDIYGTDMCIGVDTALNTIVDAIDKLRDTASSHSRAFLIETMGRQSGYLAIHAGIIAGAEMVLVPEFHFTVDEIAQTVDSAYLRGKTHAIIVVAEGANPSVTQLAEIIEARELGFKVRVTILGHIQRGGKPSAFDRMLASRFGYNAVLFLLENKSGMMVGLQDNKVTPIPLENIIAKKRELNQEYFRMAKDLAQ